MGEEGLSGEEEGAGAEWMREQTGVVRMTRGRV
jgi:hypothetical protein